MNKNVRYWLIGAFLAGFLATGVPYWPIPYSKVSLPDALYGAGLVVVAMSAAAARALGKANLFAAIIVAGAAVPAAVIARVALETSRDPTSHNLWPLEVIIALFVGMVSASMGGLAGSLPAVFYRRSDV